MRSEAPNLGGSPVPQRKPRVAERPPLVVCLCIERNRRAVSTPKGTIMDQSQRVHYEAVLRDLQKQQLELQASISFIQRALGVSGPIEAVGAAAPSEGAAPLPAHIESDTFFGMSMLEASKKYLAMSKKKQSIGQIADALNAGGLTHASKNFAATLSSILAREFREGGAIVRVSRGEWGLAEWYPGMRKRRSDQAGDKAQQEPMQDQVAESEPVGEHNSTSGEL